jgi:hypothetical protein
MKGSLHQMERIVRRARNSEERFPTDFRGCATNQAAEVGLSDKWNRQIYLKVLFIH